MTRVSRKAVVIGLDCATPQYAFSGGRSELPNLAAIRERGTWGLLESCVPAITCPAWMCMATSRDPGQLGIYGFRNRADHGYGPLRVPDSSAIKSETVWDVASRCGRKSLIMGVPLTYPPKPLNGWLVSGFLTPGTDVEYTYPSDLRDDVHEEIANYEIDVTDFRTDDKENLLRRIYEVTRRHFSAFEQLLITKPWDLAWFVEMGVDRIQHAFWRYAARDHRLHEPGNIYEDAIARYYRYVDSCIGRVRSLLPRDTLVLVVSDHGARTFQGSLCINEWLIREGYLVLRGPVAKPGPLRSEMVDWSRTRLWAEGGYYARIFANVRGREPEGIVEPDQLSQLLAEVTARLQSVVDDAGAPMSNQVFRPERLYRQVCGIPPDLLVYFGGLGWRAAATVGEGKLYAEANDTGPDDANHAQHGVFLLDDPLDGNSGMLEGVSIYDIAPTLLERIGLPVPEAMVGTPLGSGRHVGAAAV